MSRVFISYSHANEKWKDRVKVQLGVLAQQGLLDIWDDRRIDAGDDWHSEISVALDDAHVALLLITAEFLNSSFILSEEVPRLLEQRKQNGVRVIPVICEPCSWQEVPWLCKLQGRPKDNKPLLSLPEHEWKQCLADLAREVKSLTQPSLKTNQQPTTVQTKTIKIDRLPTVAGEFFGREAELALLDEALAACGGLNPSRPPLIKGGATLSNGVQDNLTSLENRKVAFQEGSTGENIAPSLDKGRAGVGFDTLTAPRIIQFIASGGTGKTKLLRHWLNQHQDAIGNYIIWSFYSQGTSDSKQVSATPLFTEAFKAFDVDYEQFKTDEDRADALADLLIEHQCLLVLDGLEPLQHGGTGFDGQLKDRAIKRLLQKLAQGHSSLCIITTRINVHELKDRAHVISHPLDNLSTGDGVKLLHSWGVQGADKEMQRAVVEVEGHPMCQASCHP